MTSGPKIVHIETRYVETDPINFRDVVQRLTGKNSSTTNAATVAASSSSAYNNTRGNDGVSVKPHEDNTDCKKKSVASSMLLMNVSFKDFEGLLSDLPPMEELLRL